MVSRWTNRPPTSSRTRRVAWLIAAATLALLVGVATTAFLRRPSGGGLPPPSRETAAASERTPLASGDAALQNLPPPRAGGHLLVTTAGCRLELIALPSGQASQPRPDVRSCQASILPSPWLAVAAIGTSSAQPVWRILGLDRSADRDLPSKHPVDYAIAQDGSIAVCDDVNGINEITQISRNGETETVKGCSPAWWRGMLVRVDPAGRVVGGTSSAVVARWDTHGMVDPVGALAASTDGSHLVVIHGEGPEFVFASVFDGHGRLASTLQLPYIGGRISEALVSNDGSLVAVLTNTGWTIARADATVSAITDVARSVIIDVAFAPDSSSIAVALAHRIAFLDPATLGPIAQLPVEADTVDWGA